jgi:hypothetical protein
MIRARCLAALAGFGLLVPTIGHSQVNIPLSPRALPKGEPVAETRLLMEGIVHANYKGLDKMLSGRPEDAEDWTFARGQALLIAESGNLLLLRPPKLQGQDAWNKSSVEMREAATRLARAASARDLNTARSRLVEVSNSCNKCHQAFGINVKLTPFVEEKPVPMPPAAE